MAEAGSIEIPVKLMPIDTKFANLDDLWCVMLELRHDGQGEDEFPAYKMFGPFYDEGQAEHFAEFLRLEVGPAQVKGLCSPLDEMLRFHGHIKDAISRAELLPDGLTDGMIPPIQVKDPVIPAVWDRAEPR